MGGGRERYRAAFDVEIAPRTAGDEDRTSKDEEISVKGGKGKKKGEHVMSNSTFKINRTPPSPPPGYPGNGGPAGPQGSPDNGPQVPPESGQQRPPSRPSPGPGQQFGRLTRFLLLGLLILVGWVMLTSREQQPPVSYTFFRNQVKSGNVAQVVVKGENLYAKLRSPARPDSAATAISQIRTYVPSFGDDSLLTLMNTHGVEITTRSAQSKGWGIGTILLFLGPVILAFLVGWMILRGLGRQGQQIFSLQRSRAKQYRRTKERVTFDDVAGVDQAKTELSEITAYLDDPDWFRKLGGKPPRGVLLVGPPGTGKTLLARATAGEAKVSFFSITGSDFMEMFVGVGASRVRSLFQDARRAAPSVIFIDELDSVGRRRGAGFGGGHDEREQTLNQLLSEMDGFEPHETVVVMAATNRPDVLDPALLRPGRFDRRITVDLPTTRARRKILAIHARNKPLADDIDLLELAKSTPGFSGADLENLLNEAALLATRKRKNAIAAADVEEARDKILLGLEREGLVLTREESRLLAYHEAGHAVVAAVLPNADPVHKVSIVPRGSAMGMTQQRPEGDRYIYSREYLVDRLAVMLGGRASESLFLGRVTSGAADDLRQVSHLARKMVTELGMSERFPLLTLDDEDAPPFLAEDVLRGRQYSEETAREIDEAVRALVDQAYERACRVLRDRKEGLRGVVQQLLEHEEISGARVLELLHLQVPKSNGGSEDGARSDDTLSSDDASGSDGGSSSNDGSRGELSSSSDGTLSSADVSRSGGSSDSDDGPSSGDSSSSDDGLTSGDDSNSGGSSGSDDGSKERSESTAHA